MADLMASNLFFRKRNMSPGIWLKGNKVDEIRLRNEDTF